MKWRKENWESAYLNAICDVRDGTHDSPKYHKNGFPLITSKNIMRGFIDFSETNLISEEDYSQINKRSFVDDGDILLSMIGTVGVPVLVKKKIDFAIKNVGLIKFNKSLRVINNYLLFVIQSGTFQKKIESKSSGTAQKFISLGLLRELEIPLPPLDEQKQIASLFQSIETAIEKVGVHEKNLKTLQQKLINGLLSPEPVFGNLLNTNNCKPTTFGEIADCDKKYPEHSDVATRFVGLENIESGNFQLQGWGDTANGTTFTKRFTKGDILFGKRRAYLKKVAIADFDGVCSGDILVIRAKDKKILQELLPFYISSDAFMQHAVSTSAGSLSPRTKWKDLAELEVSIPDLKAQAKILEVMQQIETTVSLLKQQKTTLKNLKEKLLEEILG